MTMTIANSASKRLEVEQFVFETRVG